MTTSYIDLKGVNESQMTVTKQLGNETPTRKCGTAHQKDLHELTGQEALHVVK
eukprot:SAG31_NODE_1480_length_8180_cov_5.458978_7_plen_53_part_00